MRPQCSLLSRYILFVLVVGFQVLGGNVQVNFAGGLGYPPRAEILVNDQQLEVSFNSAISFIWIYDRCSLNRKPRCPQYCSSLHFCPIYCDRLCCVGQSLLYTHDLFWKNGFDSTGFSFEDGYCFHYRKPDGAEAEGVHINATLTVRNRRNRSESYTCVDEFGLVRFANDAMIVNVFANGEMGLGVSSQRPAWFQRAYTSGRLEWPWFTIHTPQRNKSLDRGKITFGASTCASVPVWYPCTSDKNWVLPVEAIIIGNRTIAVNHTALLQPNLMHVHVPPPLVPLVADRFAASFDAAANRFLLARRLGADERLCVVVYGTPLCVAAPNLVDRLYNAAEAGELLLKRAAPAAYRDEADWLLGMPFFRARCLVHDFARMALGVADEDRAYEAAFPADAGHPP